MGVYKSQYAIQRDEEKKRQRTEAKQRMKGMVIGELITRLNPFRDGRPARVWQATEENLDARKADFVTLRPATGDEIIAFYAERDARKRKSDREAEERLGHELWMSQPEVKDAFLIGGGHNSSARHVTLIVKSFNRGELRLLADRLRANGADTNSDLKWE